jgi:hypothetical protein
MAPTLSEAIQEKTEAEAAEDDAWLAEVDAQWKLTNVVPTTFAGVLALLAYSDDLYTGALALPEEPQNWHSGREVGGFLGVSCDDEVLDKFSGEPIELPLIFWIMRNVRTALQDMAVRS